MELDEIRRAENELLTSALRRDSARLAELLHPEFVEAGRSGTLWSRDETIAALAHEPDRETPATSEWALHSVAPGFTLVTYVVSRPEGDSRHSSLWVKRDGQLQIRFHQGTFISPSG
ncbi:nuclear transport factor 2 family protein [Microbacterium sp. NPDC076895]|uniref:nuclear transport factor 2 family protein n=1 Tax=Microbacterium sp. NPDC076895 TaxID=3154957 RepID=UPI00344559AA